MLGWDKTHIFIFILLFSLTPLPINAQVVLSEIMFDAVGSDSHDEFLEIYNLSKSTAVDLAGWQLSDGNGVDNIIDFGSGTILQPQQFAVILDPSYFANSGIYDDLIPSESLILTLDNLTFGSGGFANSTPETVSLINSQGDVVSQYTYSIGNPAGFSDEKIELEGSNLSPNWADSKMRFGTPGQTNSVSPLEFDLAIFDNDIGISPEQPSAGESVMLTALVRNVGKNSVSDFEVTFFDDFDHDEVAENGEELGGAFQFKGNLLPRDSTSFSVEYVNVSPGLHLIFAKVEALLDQQPSNNLASRPLTVQFPKNSVVVNEIMYSPSSTQTEWIEIFNPGSFPIDLRGWSISDIESENRTPFSKEVFLAPGGFYVLAEDSSILQRFQLPPGSFAVSSQFPTLNNDFDSVVLYDLTDAVIDRVDYQSSWGGERGISLEKINPILPPGDSLNWSSSVAFTGGTPGLQNSIFTQALPSQTSLKIEPNPFSPDNDGNDDFTIISYELPTTTAAVNIKIYDVRGRLIRFLANNRASGSSNSVVWNGIDDRGQIARMGIYIVFLQALNAQAGILKTEKKTVVLAGRL